MPYNVNMTSSGDYMSTIPSDAPLQQSSRFDSEAIRVATAGNRTDTLGRSDRLTGTEYSDTQKKSLGS